MASHVFTYIYGQDKNAFGTTTGIPYSFPVAMSEFIALTPPVVFGSVTMNAKVKVLIGSEPYVKAPEFYTTETVSDLNTKANL